MTVTVCVTFEEGIPLDLINEAVAIMGITSDNPPKGNISHGVSEDNNQVVFVDIWESWDDFNDFVKKVATPAFVRYHIPDPDVEVL